MLLIFLILNVVLAVCLLFVEININKLRLEYAFFKMFGFLIISIVLSFLINHFINPHQSFQPPKNTLDKKNEYNENKIDEQNTNPDLLKALKKSIIDSGSSLNNSLLNGENFFTANKNMFNF